MFGSAGVDFELTTTDYHAGHQRGPTSATRGYFDRATEDYVNIGLR